MAQIPTSVLQSIPNLQFVRLTSDHQIKPFDCGEKDLNDFLFNDAKNYSSFLLTTTYIFETPQHTIAYFSVQNDKLSISSNSSKSFKSRLRKKNREIKSDTFLFSLFGFNQFPAVKIARLAVDNLYQNKGIGTEIMEAMALDFTIESKTGCTFLTVDALNKSKTLRFYMKNGFSFLNEETSKSDSVLMYKCLL